MTSVLIQLPSTILQATQKIIPTKGLDLPSDSIKSIPKSRKSKKGPLFRIHRINRSFLLFDWEFFSNELEYE